MGRNITVIIGSPKLKGSNSASIAKAVEKKFEEKNVKCSELYLAKEIDKKDRIFEEIDNADVVILVAPVFENSLPSIIIKFFEDIYLEKDKLTHKNRKMFTIMNSGFPEVEAGNSSIKTCSLFARNMNFQWLGGFSVPQGPLIDGKELDKVSSCKNIIKAIELVVYSICNDKDIPDEVFKLTSKPLMSPFIYKLAGKLIASKTKKAMGKDKYMARPLSDN